MLILGNPCLLSNTPEFPRSLSGKEKALCNHPVATISQCYINPRVIYHSSLTPRRQGVFQELWYFVRSTWVIALLCSFEMCVLNRCF